MKKNIIIIIAILIIATISIGGYFLIKNNSASNDAMKFKDEYEALNGKNDFHDKTARSVSIPKKNPIVYATFDDVINLIDKQETFIVYFGFIDCPWCRSMITTFLNTAIDNNIDKIYYVDIYTTRDVYELNDDGESVKTKDADKSYYELLNLLDNVLDDYTLTGADDKQVNVGEKRIFAPNIIAIVDGLPVINVATSELQETAYQELTSEIINDMKNIYNNLFKLVK